MTPLFEKKPSYPAGETMRKDHTKRLRGEEEALREHVVEP